MVFLAQPFCSPFHIHGGQSEGHALEQEDHEEALAEGAVPNALAIIAGLWRHIAPLSRGNVYSLPPLLPPTPRPGKSPPSYTQGWGSPVQAEFHIEPFYASVSSICTMQGDCDQRQLRAISPGCLDTVTKGPTVPAGVRISFCNSQGSFLQIILWLVQ